MFRVPAPPSVGGDDNKGGVSIGVIAGVVSAATVCLLLLLLLFIFVVRRKRKVRGFGAGFVRSWSGFGPGSGGYLLPPCARQRLRLLFDFVVH